MATEQEHFHAAREWQERADNALSSIGIRAPSPVVGQTVRHYCRELGRSIKRTCLPQNDPLYETQWRQLKGDALGVLLPQLFEKAVVQYRNPATVPSGTYRMITRTDTNGQKIH